MNLRTRNGNHGNAVNRLPMVTSCLVSINRTHSTVQKRLGTYQIRSSQSTVNVLFCFFLNYAIVATWKVDNLKVNVDSVVAMEITTLVAMEIKTL